MEGTLEERVVATIIDQLAVSEEKKKDVVPTAGLKTDLGADSLDATELIMKLEEEFDITISDEEAVKVITVGDVINLVKGKTSGSE